MTRGATASSRLAAAVFAAVLLAPAPSFAQAEEAGDGVVRIVLFSASYCAACREVKATTLAALSERYGERLAIRDLDIQDPDNYGRLIAVEDAFGVPPEARVVPTVLIGDRMLAGREAISEELPGLVEQALREGGTEWPRLTTAPPPSAPRSDHAERHERRPIWAAYFFQTGCRECSRVEADLRWVAERHPALAVRELNVYEHAPLAWWLAERAGRDAVTTPALFIGDDALIVPEELSPHAIEALVERYEAAGASPPWAGFEREAAESELRQRFEGIGPLTVVVAGLLDGVNPCAFATLIFFVSYLSLSGRRGRQILAVGAAFTVAVFGTYLAVGLGLYRALDALGGAMATVGRWVLILTAVLCVVLAVASFLDWRKARSGRLEDMSLNLPVALRDRIHAVIRRTHSARAWVAAAFATGVVVSLLELACTGQVYLPTLVFLTSDPELRARASLYLLLYNALFVLPLVVVFALVFFGTTSKQLTQFLRRRAGAVKLGMTALFATLAVWLFLTAASA